MLQALRLLLKKHLLWEFEHRTFILSITFSATTSYNSLHLVPQTFVTAFATSYLAFLGNNYYYKISLKFVVVVGVVVVIVVEFFVQVN